MDWSTEQIKSSQCPCQFKWNLPSRTTPQVPGGRVFRSWAVPLKLWQGPSSQWQSTPLEKGLPILTAVCGEQSGRPVYIPVSITSPYPNLTAQQKHKQAQQCHLRLISRHSKCMYPQSNQAEPSRLSSQHNQVEARLSYLWHWGAWEPTLPLYQLTSSP